MTTEMTCPKCGPVLRCDECNGLITADHLAAKVVHHGKLAASPIVWGEWCSSECLMAAIKKAIDGSNTMTKETVGTRGR